MDLKKKEQSNDSTTFELKKKAGVDSRNETLNRPSSDSFNKHSDSKGMSINGKTEKNYQIVIGLLILIILMVVVNPFKNRNEEKTYQSSTNYSTSFDKTESTTVRFEARSNKQLIDINETVSVSFIMDKNVSSFYPPTFDDFFIKSGPTITYKEPSTSTYTYDIKPKKKGYLTISGAQLTYKNKTYNTLPLTIKVESGVVNKSTSNTTYNNTSINYQDNDYRSRNEIINESKKEFKNSSKDVVSSKTNSKANNQPQANKFYLPNKGTKEDLSNADRRQLKRNQKSIEDFLDRGFYSTAINTISNSIEILESKKSSNLDIEELFTLYRLYSKRAETKYRIDNNNNLNADRDVKIAKMYKDATLN